MKYPIYLDYNATTPCTEEVMESMLPFFSIHFGNTASKSHPFGWVAENAVEEAREKIAQLIGAKSKEIIFTSGATEALNLAIKGTFEAFLPGKQHFITCQTEHKAVLDCFEEIEKRGGEVTYLPVDEMGKISIDQLVKAILPTTKCEDRNLILITDAVQAAGKIPVSTSGIHLMAISSHKLYGPKGIGALYVRHNHELPKPLAQIHGGGHEKGIRSGTLNVPGIVGFGRAAELRMEEMNEEANRLQKLRDRLQEGLLKISGTQLNGSQDNRLPHVCNIAFSGVEGEELLKRVDPDLGRASIRFSLGRKTSEDEILQTIDWVEKVVKELRE